jgi:beta-glucuronidase
VRLLSALAVVVGLAFVLPHVAQAAGPPGPVSLDGGWQFAPDAANRGVAQDWQSGQRGSGWQPVTLPHVADARTDPDLFKGSIGWYRLTFTGPSIAAGMHWAVRFEQVRRTARVWLNGQAIGVHRDPYSAFELPMPALRIGQPNTLVVRANYRRPAGLREGWWNWGGITREVSLVARGSVVTEDAGLLPRRVCKGSSCSWQVLFDGWLANGSNTVQQPAVSVQLTSPDGDTSQGSASPRALRPGERVRVRFAIPIRGKPEQWDPDHPNLYASTIATSVGGQVTQVDHLSIGLRTVDVVGGMMRLNGRVLDLRGASLTEDIPGHGPALTDADVNTIVGELKSLGANVTRAHYLPDPRILAALDKAGIMLWSQAPVYHRDKQLVTPGERSHELDVERATILAARNHPAVITHSVANELTVLPDTHRTTQVWMKNAAALSRDLDPTLPVAIDILSYPGVPQQRTYDAFDLLGINSYYGWYAGKANRSTANIDDLQPYLRKMHAMYPQKALVMTEFGAEATEPGPADVKQTYGFQTQYLKRNLAIVDRLGFMTGAIYWTAREFAVKPHWDGGAHPLVRDSIHNKGLISYDGKPKPAFKAAQQAFKATPLYRADPAAVARAELTNGGPVVLRTLLFLAMLALVGGLMALDAICLRDIWRAWRPPPPEGQVVELPTRRVA